MTQADPLFLGVDAGGTKTAVCIVDRDGTRRAQIRAPSMYYFDEGIGLVERVLEQAVTQACAEAAVSLHAIAYAFIGFPGYGEASADTPVLDAIPEQVFGHARYSCGNDMICGWAGSLGATDGINVVSGTGSMAYGERDGTGVRAGGWGGGVRRRGLRILDRRPGAAGLLRDERRPDATRAAARRLS